MRKLFYFSFLLLLASNLSGQRVKIPTDYQLKTVEDYEPYKDSVRIAANWMINTPLNENPVMRAKANDFLFRWVSGAPYTHIEIKPEYTNEVMNDKSNVYAKDLLFNYIAGMTLVKIDNRDVDDIIVQEAGVKAMITGYKSIRSESKNKFLEKLLKIEKKGELSQWVKDNYINYDQKDKAKIVPKD